MTRVKAPVAHIGIPGEEVGLASSGHAGSAPDRRGTIIRVLVAPGRVHYYVHWHDGRESIVPASAATLIGPPA